MDGLVQGDGASCLGGDSLGNLVGDFFVTALGLKYFGGMKWGRIGVFQIDYGANFFVVRKNRTHACNEAKNKYTFKRRRRLSVRYEGSF